MVANTKKISILSDCTLNVKLKGGSGGDGGSDSRAGHPGYPGNVVNVSIDAKAGEVYYVANGKSGQNGVNSTKGNPGNGGESFPGYTGGRGGGAGSSGVSGSGGGGGGATVLYKYVFSEPRIIAIAAGGGGGGGGGASGAGLGKASANTELAFVEKYYTSHTTNITNAADALKTYAVETDKTSTTYTFTYYFWVAMTSGAAFDATLLVSSNGDTIRMRTAQLGTNLVAQNGSVVTTYVPSTTKNNTFSVELGNGLNRITFEVTRANANITLGAYIVDYAGVVGDVNSVLWNTRSYYNADESSIFIGRGGAGLTHKDDGGGGGGGGGGVAGGVGGSIGSNKSNDIGAYSGSDGISYAPGKETVIPIQSKYKFYTDQTISSNISTVGESGDGYFTANSLFTNINVRKSETFLKVPEMYNYINGEWTLVTDAYYYDGTDWVRLYGKDTFIIEDAPNEPYELFNNDSSEPAYPPPPPPPPVYPVSTEANIIYYNFVGSGYYDSGVIGGYGGIVTGGGGTYGTASPGTDVGSNQPDGGGYYE